MIQQRDKAPEMTTKGSPRWPLHNRQVSSRAMRTGQTVPRDKLTDYQTSLGTYKIAFAAFYWSISKKEKTEVLMLFNLSIYLFWECFLCPT